MVRRPLPSLVVAIEFLSDRLRRRIFGRSTGRISVRAQPLGGGLEADAVHLVRAAGRDVNDRRVERTYVRKVAQGVWTREAEIYREVLHRHGANLAPRLLAVERPARATAVLCLEAVQAHHRWPWRNVESSAAVLERIARLHAIREVQHVLPPWDYEAELAESAIATAGLVRRLAMQPATARLVRDAVPAVESLASELPRVRRQLLSSPPFGRCIIHGDLHPGNVVERDHADPVVFDWARARVGSPLEDVSSWLQSLAYWEPEARRRHDTLFVRYLAARGLAARLTAELRDLYWLAAACNALSGALIYHLSVAADERRDRSTAERSASYARDWIRILRRARASLR